MSPSLNFIELFPSGGICKGIIEWEGIGGEYMFWGNSV